MHKRQSVFEALQQPVILLKQKNVHGEKGENDMKKRYETPSADKIRFDYREQVVAASGGSSSDSPYERTIFSDGCNIQSLIAMGYDICSMRPF